MSCLLSCHTSSHCLNFVSAASACGVLSKIQLILLAGTQRPRGPLLHRDPTRCSHSVVHWRHFSVDCLPLHFPYQPTIGSHCITSTSSYPQTYFNSSCSNKKIVIALLRINCFCPVRSVYGLLSTFQSCTCLSVQMLQQGFPPDSCDYDKRTGLMLASTRGHIPVVELLLAAGAPVDQLDSFGQTALSEACKFGQEETIAVLRRAGAK